MKEELILFGVEAALQLGVPSRWLKKWLPRYTHIALERAKMTPTLWYSILRRDKWRCYLCGIMNYQNKEFGKVKMQVDHEIPLARYGTTVPSNLRSCCSTCNRAKSTKTVDEYLKTRH